MPLNRELMLRHSPPDQTADYSSDDTILYALSIGLGDDPTDERRLRFVFENQMIAFPTMALVIGWSSALNDPSFGIERGGQVVSELAVAWSGAVPPEGRLLSRTRIIDVLDLGKGALIKVQRTLHSESGYDIATVETGIFVRGAGGFSGGSPKGKPQETNAAPAAPDVTCDMQTSPNMGLLYRLNGDRNPLHANPQLARKLGFCGPILHGQATLAVAAHAIVRTILGYDTSRLRRIRARFVKPFYPGEVLRTECWLTGDSIMFRARSVERDAIVIDNGEALIGSVAS